MSNSTTLNCDLAFSALVNLNDKNIQIQWGRHNRDMNCDKMLLMAEFA